MTIRLLICDFDNTLYDWVSYFVPSFYRMVGKAATVLGCTEDELLDDLRAVHQRYKDSEHPFALLETEAVSRRFSGVPRGDVARLLDSAFHEFNRSRKETLRLYPDVKSTLATLKARGVGLVGHTEAKYLAASDRLHRLGLTEFFSRVYCKERSPSSRPDDLASFTQEVTMSTDLVELSHHQAKPSPEVLREICVREEVELECVAYVGDSLFKDILMANRAGVRAIWAKYGTAGYHGDYERLVRVSHWREEDIAFERALRARAGEIRPDVTLEHKFSEILTEKGLLFSSHPLPL